MKKTIRINLRNLFNRHFDVIKNQSFSDFIDSITNDNPEALNLNTNYVESMYDDEDIIKLEGLKNNQELSKLYNSLKQKLRPECNISESIKLDILDSIEVIKKRLICYSPLTNPTRLRKNFCNYVNESY